MFLPFCDLSMLLTIFQRFSFRKRHVKMRLEIDAPNLLFPRIPGTTHIPDILGLSLITHYTVN